MGKTEASKKRKVKESKGSDPSKRSKTTTIETVHVATDGSDRGASSSSSRETAANKSPDFTNEPSTSTSSRPRKKKNVPQIGNKYFIPAKIRAPSPIRLETCTEKDFESSDEEDKKISSKKMPKPIIQNCHWPVQAVLGQKMMDRHDGKGRRLHYAVKFMDSIVPESYIRWVHMKPEDVKDGINADPKTTDLSCYEDKKSLVKMYVCPFCEPDKRKAPSKNKYNFKRHIEKVHPEHLAKMYFEDERTSDRKPRGRGHRNIIEEDERRIAEWEKEEKIRKNEEKIRKKAEAEAEKNKKRDAKKREKEAKADEKKNHKKSKKSTKSKTMKKLRDDTGDNVEDGSDTDEYDAMPITGNPPNPDDDDDNVGDDDGNMSIPCQ